VALAAADAPHLGHAATLAATGLRSTTRLAAGRGALFAQVMVENKDEVLATLASMRRALDSLEQAIGAADLERLAGLLEEARLARARVVGEADATIAPARDGSTGERVA
jgi:prephenate dehydrogenase